MVTYHVLSMCTMILTITYPPSGYLLCVVHDESIQWLLIMCQLWMRFPSSGYLSCVVYVVTYHVLNQAHSQGGAVGANTLPS